ncbi:MAG: YaaA family protein [Patescibacteria group bacterium]
MQQIRAIVQSIASEGILRQLILLTTTSYHMKIVLSPAKSQDFETPWTSAVTPTKPIFLKTTAQLVKTLSKLDKAELAKTLSVSATLAKRNYQAYQTWTMTHSLKTAKPALLAYTGDVYQQLSAALYTEHQQRYAQDNLRIVTGLYGYLRAYDLIRPYRLEMKTKIHHSGDQVRMSDFWRTRITKRVQKELQADEQPLLINLASQEYTAAVDFEKIDQPYYSITFQQVKSGQPPKVIGLLAKRARGMMLEYLIRNGCTTLEEVKRFAAYGYSLTKETEHDLVFTSEEV